MKELVLSTLQRQISVNLCGNSNLCCCTGDRPTLDACRVLKAPQSPRIEDFDLHLLAIAELESVRRHVGP